MRSRKRIDCSLTCMSSTTVFLVMSSMRAVALASRLGEVSAELIGELVLLDGPEALVQLVDLRVEGAVLGVELVALVHRGAQLAARLPGGAELAHDDLVGARSLR